MPLLFLYEEYNSSSGKQAYIHSFPHILWASVQKYYWHQSSYHLHKIIIKHCLNLPCIVTACACPAVADADVLSALYDTQILISHEKRSHCVKDFSIILILPIYIVASLCNTQYTSSSSLNIDFTNFIDE